MKVQKLIYRSLDLPYQLTIFEKFEIGLLSGQKRQKVSKARTKDIPKLSNVHQLTILKLGNVHQLTILKLGNVHQ